MPLQQRDLFSAINSFNSQLASDVGITATSTSQTASSTESVNTTTSSSLSTTSAKASSTVKSTASSTSKSISSSTENAAASTITSNSTSTSSSSSSSVPSSSSAFPSSSTPSSTSSTSIIPPTSTVTSTSTPAPTSSSASGNQISTPGIAVAAIFGLLILLAILYLLWKYLPACRRYRERSYQIRSHRSGLPFTGPRKGLAFTDEESIHDLHLDDPQLGLGLRKFSFHTAPTYYPGQPDSDGDLSQRRPLTSASQEHEIVSPISIRSTRSQFSQSTLPSALQVGAPAYPFPQHFQYRDVRASQIGVAVPFAGSGNGISRPSTGGSRPGSREKGLPPLPLPSIGYRRPFG